jgi:hypothetical protein
MKSIFTVKRITSYACLLALCLWTLYTINLSTSGLHDRAGLIKGADFVHFYTAGSLVESKRLDILYNPLNLAEYQLKILPETIHNYYIANYGPQVYLLFSPLSHLSYGKAAIIWAVINFILYFICFHIWLSFCPQLRPYTFLTCVLAVAFPGFFSVIASGQTSVLALALFTLAFLALRSNKKFLAGLAIGTLIFKPQLGIAAAAVFLFTLEWEVVAGAITSLVSQLAFAWTWFGTVGMKEYFLSLLRIDQIMPFIEPRASQVYSLKGFFLLLIPWHNLAMLLCICTSSVVLGFTLAYWVGPAPLVLRYTVLLLATVLVSPHLMSYDLVILMPVFLILSNWVLEQPSDFLKLLLLLTYMFPLLEPEAQFTHIQFSTLGFTALFVYLYQKTGEKEWKLKSYTPSMAISEER